MYAQRSLVVAASDKDTVDDVCAGKTDAAFLDQFTVNSILVSGIHPCAEQIAPDPFADAPIQVARGSTLQASAAADDIRRGIDALAIEVCPAKILRNGLSVAARPEILQRTAECPKAGTLVDCGGRVVYVSSRDHLVHGIRIIRQRNRITATARALRESEQKLRLTANAIPRTNSPKEGPIFWMHRSDRSRMAGYWNRLFEGAAYRMRSTGWLPRTARSARRRHRMSRPPIISA
jgi:hypothetical protein